MLNKNDFLKYASKLAFPIMIQNLIGTLVNIADTVMLGYVSQTAMSASSLANQYTFILFCLYYGMATGASVLCAQYWGKGDKKTVERILGLAERISLIVSLVFFVISFSMPTTIMKIFTSSMSHSDICGSSLVCKSPQLFAAYHVLLSLQEPRHPPYALTYFLFPLCIPYCICIAYISSP